jgi:hypothetical protein
LGVSGALLLVSGCRHPLRLGLARPARPPFIMFDSQAVRVISVCIRSWRRFDDTRACVDGAQ